MNNPTRAATGALQDPAERWEIPTSEAESRAYFRGVHEIFPRAPRRESDVPTEAREALTESCRVAAFRQFFLVPGAVRFTGVPGQLVASPDSVLAMGTSAVGLWTARPEPGVKVLIPLSRLAAVEDATVLLYSRLRFISFEETLTVRYNALARAGLRPALLELRERLYDAPLPLPPGEPPAAHLPMKWRRLLRSPVARLRDDMPVAVRFTVEPGAPGDDVQRGQLLVLSPHELVYLCDPREASHNYGEDLFIVPRQRITRVRARERYLEVSSNGARLCLDMAVELRQAAGDWFAGAS